MRFKLWLLATLWIILTALWLHTPMFVWLVSSEGALRIPLLGVWFGVAGLLIFGALLQLPFRAYDALVQWWKTRKKTQGFCALAAQEWSQAEQYLQQEDPFWAALAARGQGAFTRSLEHLQKVQVTSLIPAKAVDLLKAENYVDLGDYAQAKILLEHIAPLKKHKSKIALLLIQCYERLDLSQELTQAFYALPRLGLESHVLLALQKKLFLQLLTHCQTERFAWQLWKHLPTILQDDPVPQMAFLQQLISVGAHKSAIRHAVQLLSRGWHEELVGFLSQWGKEDQRYVSAWAKNGLKATQRAKIYHVYYRSCIQRSCALSYFEGGQKYVENSICCHRSKLQRCSGADFKGRLRSSFRVECSTGVQNLVFKNGYLFHV